MIEIHRPARCDNHSKPYSNSSDLNPGPTIAAAIEIIALGKFLFAPNFGSINLQSG